MATSQNILIAGAGGIGQALAFILAEFSETPPVLWIGNRTLEKAQSLARQLTLSTTSHVRAIPFHLTLDAGNESMEQALREADVLLDCLPGSEAPRLARLAREYRLHYANLTEHVQETEEIVAIARDAPTGFLLQTGLAPGFVNVLANGLFQHFCRRHGVDHAQSLIMRVGALTRHALPPHYYGFTWSPAGVATEYVHPAWCVRDARKAGLPALSERETILINGITYEADLTSGGAADLPDALAGRVKRLDYKTLRYPGHYDWVAGVLRDAPAGADPGRYLQEQMEASIPHVEDDEVLIYAAVEGSDRNGIGQRTERAYHLHPQRIGRHLLRAIQTTTAAPLAQAAEWLLTGRHKGPVFQSQIDPVEFLNGRFVTAVYGRWNGAEAVPGVDLHS